MAGTIRTRRDTAANWTSTDPTLAVGERGLETDTGNEKVGDGSTAWTSLGYVPSTLPTFTPSSTDMNHASWRVQGRVRVADPTTLTNGPSSIVAGDGIATVLIVKFGTAFLHLMHFDGSSRAYSRTYDGSAWNAWSAAGMFTDAVATAHIQASAVTTAKIADDNVTTAKILNDNVTEAKLAAAFVATVVRTTGAQNVGGVKTFTDGPVWAADPSTASQLARKSYVDSLTRIGAVCVVQSSASGVDFQTGSNFSYTGGGPTLTAAVGTWGYLQFVTPSGAANATLAVGSFSAASGPTRPAGSVNHWFILVRTA